MKTEDVIRLTCQTFADGFWRSPMFALSLLPCPKRNVSGRILLYIAQNSGFDNDRATTKAANPLVWSYPVTVRHLTSQLPLGIAVALTETYIEIVSSGSALS